MMAYRELRVFKVLMVLDCKAYKVSKVCKD